MIIPLNDIMKADIIQLEDYDMYYNLGSKFLVKLRHVLRKIKGKDE